MFCAQKGRRQFAKMFADLLGLVVLTSVASKRDALQQQSIELEERLDEASLRRSRRGDRTVDPQDAPHDEPSHRIVAQEDVDLFLGSVELTRARSRFWASPSSTWSGRLAGTTTNGATSSSSPCLCSDELLIVVEFLEVFAPRRVSHAPPPRLRWGSSSFPWLEALWPRVPPCNEVVPEDAEALGVALGSTQPCPQRLPCD